MADSGSEHLMRLCRQQFRIRETCQKKSEKRQASHGRDDPRTVCFAMAFNIATITIEILDHYRNIWSLPATLANTKDPQHSARENGMRFLEVSRYQFIKAFSIVEFSIRDLVESLPDTDITDCIRRRERLLSTFDHAYDQLDKTSRDLLRPVRRLVRDVPPYDSFSRIIGRSSSVGLIPAEDSDCWMALAEIRNICVHNNCIGWRDSELCIRGRHVALHKGGMTRGTHDVFLWAVNLLLDLTDEWMSAYTIWAHTSHTT